MKEQSTLIKSKKIPKRQVSPMQGGEKSRNISNFSQERILTDNSSKAFDIVYVSNLKPSQPNILTIENPYNNNCITNSSAKLQAEIELGTLSQSKGSLTQNASQEGLKSKSKRKIKKKKFASKLQEQEDGWNNDFRIFTNETATRVVANSSQKHISKENGYALKKLSNMKIMTNKTNEHETTTSPVNSSMEISPREENHRVDYPIADWIMKSTYFQNLKISSPAINSPTDLGPDIEADLSRAQNLSNNNEFGIGLAKKP